MKTFILSTLFPFLITAVVTTSGAQEQNNQVTLNPPGDVPETYVVKKGDTLWDIAEHFLDDPFQWPDIWKKNTFINDPHWIYPGQILTFFYMTLLF